MTYLWTYRAYPVKAIDGDTLEACIDHGMNIRSIQRIRLQNVDTPELFSGDQKEAGTAARNAADEWLTDTLNDGEWPLTITTVKDKRSFNRYVATVVRTSDGTNLADYLVDKGHAVRCAR